MEILIKIKKKLLVKIIVVISVILFIVAFGVLSPTFGNKITRVSYTTQNNTSIGRINLNFEIHTQKGFVFKEGNVTVKYTTEQGTFEDIIDVEYYKVQKFYYGNYSDFRVEIKVNSYRVTGYAKYVVPAVIMYLISGAGMVYCIYYWVHNRNDNNNGEQ